MTALHEYGMQQMLFAEAVFGERKVSQAIKSIARADSIPLERVIKILESAPQIPRSYPQELATVVIGLSECCDMHATLCTTTLHGVDSISDIPRAVEQYYLDLEAELRVDVLNIRRSKLFEQAIRNQWQSRGVSAQARTNTNIKIRSLLTHPMSALLHGSGFAYQLQSFTNRGIYRELVKPMVEAVRVAFVREDGERFMSTYRAATETPQFSHAAIGAANIIRKAGTRDVIAEAEILSQHENLHDGIPDAISNKRARQYLERIKAMDNETRRTYGWQTFMAEQTPEPYTIVFPAAAPKPPAPPNLLTRAEKLALYRPNQGTLGEICAGAPQRTPEVAEYAGSTEQQQPILSENPSRPSIDRIVLWGSELHSKAMERFQQRFQKLSDIPVELYANSGDKRVVASAADNRTLVIAYTHHSRRDVVADLKREVERRGGDFLPYLGQNADILLEEVSKFIAK